MPIGIDFAQIASTFSGPWGLQMKPITESFERLGKWLAKRLAATQTLERATRDFPVLRFYEGAITIWIDPAQRGILGDVEPPRTTGEVLRDAGRRFTQGLGRIGQAEQEEAIIPHLLSTLNAALNILVASIDRYQQVSPAMFNLGTHTASDLFGEVALLSRATSGSIEQVNQFKANLDTAKKLIKDAKEEKARRKAELLFTILGVALPFDVTPLVGSLLATEQKKAQEGSAIDSFPALLDDATHYLVGAILILPLLPRLLETVLGAARVALESALLSHFEEIQARVSRFRNDMVELFLVSLMDYVDMAATFVASVEGILLVNLKFYLQFGLTYGGELLGNIYRFATQLQTTLNEWLGLAEGIRSAIEKFLNFNIMPYLLALAGLAVLIPAAPPLTIGDLIEIETDATQLVKRTLSDVSLWLTQQLPGADQPELANRLEGLRLLLHELYTPAPKLPPEAALPDLSKLHFVNFYDAFFGSGAVDLRQTLDNVHTSLRSGLTDVFDGGIDFLQRTSDLFARKGAQAAQLGSPAQYEAIADQATKLSEVIFGPQIDELNSRATASDTLAEAFESWFAHGGFYVIGSAIPLYIAEMYRYWQKEGPRQHKTEPPELPTSQHITAKREKLGTVRVPRIVIQTSMREPDDVLIAAIVTHFQDAVVHSYQTGEATLKRRESR